MRLRRSVTAASILSARLACLAGSLLPLGDLARDQRGNMAFMMMTTLLGVALVAGGVVDYSSLTTQQMKVKSAADNAAIAAASEMLLVGATEEQATAVARAVAVSELQEDLPEVAVAFLPDEEIEVTVSVEPRTFFPGPVALTARTIRRTSAATIAGQGNVCLLALSETETGVWFRQNSNLEAGGCLVYSNSTASNSLFVAANADVSADFVCVSGGVAGHPARINGRVLDDCPSSMDPLANRPEPGITNEPCDVTTPVIVTGDATLTPGVYCRAIDVRGGNLTLTPGVYELRDSPLLVGGGTPARPWGGTLSGEGVGLVLTGELSRFAFFEDSTISLSAPETGDMAGLLVFHRDDPGVYDPANRIGSLRAERLVGTIYQPTRRLIISSDAPVAAESEYTVLVARLLDLGAGPALVLNTDYGASDVPVPAGLGNNARNSIRLSR